MSDDLEVPKEKALADAGGGDEKGLDAIEVLPLSESWKSTFRAIEEAGLVRGGFMPVYENVDPKKHRQLMFNGYAFFFGPIYYFVLGMPRKAVTWILTAIGLGLMSVLLGLPPFADRALGISLQVLYASNANADYYRKQIRGETFWL